jgi:chromosome segregation ATPase
MSQVKNVTLEDRITNLESEIKELKTELSIALEFYGQVYELINELNHILKTRELDKEKVKHDLTELEDFSLLKYENQTPPTKRKSKIDEELDKVVNLIFEDYKTQGQG